MRIVPWIILPLLLAVAPVVSQEPGEPMGQSSPFSQAKFVPDISLILDCSYLHRNLSDGQFAELYLPGFASAEEDEPAGKGFNLNYAEITFFSIVDPYFELFAVCHVSEHHFHLEEAYWTTKRFPTGLQLKAGKFLSSFGRINEQHAHYWDFADPPLINKAVFGGEGLNEIGARLTWVAPLDLYFMLGGEVLMGENENSFGRAGIQGASGAVNVTGVNGPGLFVGYCKASFDIDEAAVLLGVSGARGKTRQDEGFSAGSGDGVALAGNSTVLGGDFTVKYLLDAIRYISLQSEYLWRVTDATMYTGAAPALLERRPFDRHQSGFYAQAVMKFGLRWRGGVRFDLIQQNDVVEGGVDSILPEGLPRLSAMVEFNPTEFSRIRLQYDYDRSKYRMENHVESRTNLHELSLQVNLAIGAHGAHSF